MTQPTLWMLVGVPAVGKSTWVKSQNFDPGSTVVLSTDNYIEQWAQEQGSTYSEIFSKSVKNAEAAMMADLKNAVAENKNLIWDQTNLTAKTRAKKLNLIPENYLKIAVYFRTVDLSELLQRLDSRPGKTIPRNIVMGMISQLQPPTESEGFDEVTTVG